LNEENLSNLEPEGKTGWLTGWGKQLEYFLVAYLTLHNFLFQKFLYKGDKFYQSNLELGKLYSKTH
jgi:hypothetical protein